MTEHQQTTSDFDAAKAIAETLKDLDKAQQARVLRWVGESLGLAASGTFSHASPRAEERAVESPDLPSLPVPAIGAEAGLTDIRSFSRSKNPSSDNQRVAIVAFFHKFLAPASDRRETINAEILRDAMRKITGGKRLQRPGITLNNAKNQGYLDSAGRGEYKINSVGENLVTMTLGAENPAVASPRRSGSQPRKRIRKTSSKRST